MVIYVNVISPLRKVIAFPPILTLSLWYEQNSSPPLEDSWWAIIWFFFNCLYQYGISKQWAEPVTGSSLMPTFGPKKRETKSESLPGAVTIIPLCGNFFNNSKFGEIALISSWVLKIASPYIPVRKSIGLAFNMFFIVQIISFLIGSLGYLSCLSFRLLKTNVYQLNWGSW